ncbi:PREDICTED: mRNAion elongation factor [Prunus dulcis]|uniref:PREDICTED: mRNAion elongation factor n=1 Tax=Prunus dulcis TaxID=3755 RepID=A0A5E4FW88_PRUDU|nr:PREDICTED: mRNAion elongation factor [Prunus dulcis]
MDKAFVFDEEDEVMIEQDDEERVCLDGTGLETPTKCSIKSYKELRKVLFLYFKLLAKMTLNSNGRWGDANNCETTVMEVEKGRMNMRSVDAQNGPANIESNLVIRCARSSAGKRAEALGEMGWEVKVGALQKVPMWDFVQAEEEERADNAEEERHKKKKRKKREEYLLDEDDYDLLEDNNVFAPRKKEEPTEAEADGEVGEEDAMEDFIVNEEFDATGVPVRGTLREKKSRQTLGVSSSSLHEVDEIFGDVDELLLLRKQGSDSNERRVRRLEDEFEPSVLSKKYMTEKDDRFRGLIFRKEFRLFDLPFTKI